MHALCLEGMRTLRKARAMSGRIGEVFAGVAAYLVSSVLAFCVGATDLTAADLTKRDITVFVLSDTHVGAENLDADPPVTREYSRARVEATHAALRGLVGRPYARVDSQLGLVAVPRGVVLLGDLVDGHRDLARQEEQWSTFDELFPVRGLTFAEGEVPVLTCAGNHDGEPAGPLRRGLVSRNRTLLASGQLSAISSNGVHTASCWDGVHFVCLTLCAADSTDSENPFKYGRPGPGSWNDPEGALSFLANYLATRVRDSGNPVVIMQHYGFDGFSMNDWLWWTPRQRRCFYDVIQGYSIAAVFHGHNHHAEHYRWPDQERHADDLARMFPEGVPARLNSYDILSCGGLCWVVRVKGDRLLAVHARDGGWSDAAGSRLEKTLKY